MVLNNGKQKTLIFNANNERADAKKEHMGRTTFRT